MANKIQIRRGLKKDLPVLSNGEFGFAIDTKELFIGSPNGNIGVIMDDKSNPTNVFAQLNNKVSRNFINNWYFPNPINQRVVSGTITTPGYFIDRWKLISGSVTLTNKGLTLNGTIVQILETAAGTNIIASVKMYSGTANASYDNGTKTFTVTSSGGTINSVKLEIGEVSTLAYDPPMDYGKELAVCKRYQQAVNYNVIMSIHGVRLNANSLGFVIPNQVQMRINPAIIVEDSTLRIVANNLVLTDFTFSVVDTAQFLFIAATKANHEVAAADSPLLQLNKILFDANL